MLQQSGTATLPSPLQVPAPTAPLVAGLADELPARSGGVTARVVVFCLLLAVVFGYSLPIIDYKLNNTFLGATHLPPGAVGVLLLLVLVINPLLRLVSRKWALSR